jgi:6-phosphofructokinase 1
MKKRVLVLTGGGDCPGLNAVIRGIVKRAAQNPEWEVIGSIEAYNGVLCTPPDVQILDNKAVAGIHVRGGTIIGTTNKGGSPSQMLVKMPNGTLQTIDKTPDLFANLKNLGIDAVISIGGDGSQSIAQELYEKGLQVIGVPKTIDNDLSATDFTFGFQTAVQIATEAFDKLVTTAASHHRVMILEVMGRDAGWIALHTAVAGGAEICLIPEIPYHIDKVVEKINSRYKNGKGFVNIVVAEGIKPFGGSKMSKKSEEFGYQNPRLGGVAYKLSQELKEAGCQADIRETVLGHVQRGGTPTAFDRVLATQFGVKAFEMVLAGEFGRMVTYKNNTISTSSLQEAISSYNLVDKSSYLMQAARGVGISFGDNG